MSDEAVLTVAEAAAVLKCSKQTVTRLIRKGRLPATDLGTSRRSNYRLPVEGVLHIQTAAALPASSSRPTRRKLPPVPSLA